MVVSLNSRLESNKEEEKTCPMRPTPYTLHPEARNLSHAPGALPVPPNRLPAPPHLQAVQYTYQFKNNYPGGAVSYERGTPVATRPPRQP